mgnify:CR=1 FL=1
MRSMLRRYSGTQMVSNFRPTAAAALYDIFVDKNSPLEGTEAGTVWDPSMGYGGRLLGAIAAGVNYIGTDPCIPTFKGLEQIKEKFRFLNNECEGMFILEHILLRPIVSTNYITIFNDENGDEFLKSFRPAPFEDQREFRDDIYVLGVNSENYSVQKTKGKKS